LERASVELPANTSATSSTELEGLGKERALGEAANLGGTRFATANAITATIPRSATTTVPATSKRGQTKPGTTTTPSGGSTITRGPTTITTDG